LGHNGEIADRCYSVLHKDGSDWKVQTYAEAFPDYIGEIVFSIGELTRDLDLLDDPIY
jgi:hypothetical protein